MDEIIRSYGRLIIELERRYLRCSNSISATNVSLFFTPILSSYAVTRCSSRIIRKQVSHRPTGGVTRRVSHRVNYDAVRSCAQMAVCVR